MKKIKLIAELDASDFSDKVEEEFARHDFSTHYQNEVVTLTWGEERLSEFQKWLVDNYGEEIKKYNTFAVWAT